VSVEIFFDAPHAPDLAFILQGRGAAIEPGLSVIDADLPIAGLRDVDLVAIDSQRRLVVVSVARPGEAALPAQAAAQAQWFVANLPIVKRMYQLWNVDWESSQRTVCVVPHGEEEDRSKTESPEARAKKPRVEVIEARLVRTREGREAIYLSARGVVRRSGALDGADRSDVRELAPIAVAARGFAQGPPAAAARTRVDVRAARPSGAEKEQNRRHEPVLPAGEAYRRELGLTREEFREFFPGPAVEERPTRGGG
jgi:hypothetical protein